MRGWSFAWVLAGCSFANGRLIGGDGGPGDGRDDAHDAGPDTAIDSPGQSPCVVTDPNLVWCLELDEPGLATATTAIDGSGKHHDPTITNITLATRTVPASSQVITTSTASSITLTKPAEFNLQQFTISAWIFRKSTAELGVIDTERQYTLSIDTTDQTVECAISNPAQQTISYTGGSQTGANEWDLIACTYDGAQVCTYSFRNGSLQANQACWSRSSTTATTGTRSSVGSWADSNMHFVGSLDQIRVYSRALSQQEICTAGGLTGC
jgi:hypothetical protein